MDRASESARLAQQSVAEFRAAAATGVLVEEAERLDAARALAGDSALAAAYSYLQKAVGLIAISLPFVLLFGNLALGGALEGSISAYYHTGMGSYFVGSLFALAVFFLSYNYRPLPGFHVDFVLSRCATVAAVGVAVFPTASDAGSASTGEQFVSTVHLVFAGTLFGLLACFSLFLFTRTGKSSSMTAEKRRRNVVYRVCGGIIVGSMLLVVGSIVAQPPGSWNLLFWLEAVAVVAFGVSWLVKGGFLGILADHPTVALTARPPSR